MPQTLYEAVMVAVTEYSARFPVRFKDPKAGSWRITSQKVCHGKKNRE